MSRENRVGQVIKITLTVFAVIVLAFYLYIVVSILFDMVRITVRAANNIIRPSVLADHFITGFIADEIGNSSYIHEQPYRWLLFQQRIVQQSGIRKEPYP